jgi:hypothetical protein
MAGRIADFRFMIFDLGKAYLVILSDLSKAKSMYAKLWEISNGRKRVEKEMLTVDGHGGCSVSEYNQQGWFSVHASDG